MDVELESEVFSAALEYSGEKGMRQIITLMEFRWSKRTKKTGNRAGEIAKALDVDCIINRPSEKESTKKFEKRRLYFMNNHGRHFEG
jgi:hypothetical protein